MTTLQAITEANCKAMIRTFKPSQVYRIFTGGNTGSGHRASVTMGGSSWEKDCVFEYLRKEGIHHIFREARGGWTRTYTDAQLLGKVIMETQL